MTYATPRQVNVIRGMVGREGDIPPWYLSDKKAIQFLNDRLNLSLDETKTLPQQLTLSEASKIISQLQA